MTTPDVSSFPRNAKKIRLAVGEAMPVYLGFRRPGHRGQSTPHPAVQRSEIFLIPGIGIIHPTIA
jgi:hypothetical protein